MHYDFGNIYLIAAQPMHSPCSAAAKEVREYSVFRGHIEKKGKLYLDIFENILEISWNFIIVEEW